MQYRNFLSILLVAFLGCLILLAATPSGIFAQTSQLTTSISALNYPSTAVAGSPITVSFDVPYSTNQMVWLMTAITCGPSEINCNSVSMNSVNSLPLPCNSVSPFGNQYPFISGSCYLAVSTGGSEVFTYSFTFGQPGTYQLTALTQLNYPGDRTNITGSWAVSQTMTITVS
jgi:hypothetical protein